MSTVSNPKCGEKWSSKGNSKKVLTVNYVNDLDIVGFHAPWFLRRFGGGTLKLKTFLQRYERVPEQIASLSKQSKKGEINMTYLARSDKAYKLALHMVRRLIEEMEENAMLERESPGDAMADRVRLMSRSKAIMEEIDEMNLKALVEARKNQDEVDVEVDDL